MLDRRHIPHLLALLLAGAAAWLLLSGGGLLNTRGGGDSPFLLQRLHQMETAVRDGHFPVRWMPDSNYGYGYPFFNYYAPFAFYIALAFRLLGFTLVRAIQLSQLAAFITAAWGSYRLGQRWWGNDTAALISSAAYTLAPFHLVNVYVRGDSIAEFWAMAFFPLVLLAIVNVGRGAGEQGGRGDSALSTQHSALSNQHFLLSTFSLALAYAGLLLSHNISALIFSPFALLVGLVVIGQSRGAQLATLGRLAVGALLGLALSAWFWWPALAEQGFTQLDGITADYFHYSRHFRTLPELAQTSVLFSYETNALQAFRMGLVQAVLLGLGVLGGLWSIVRRHEGAGWVAVALLGTAAATLMMMPLSQPVWDALPLIAFTQFPWRFLSIQAFFGAMLIGKAASGEWLVGKHERLKPYLQTGIVVGLLITSLGGLRPDYLPIVDEAVTAEAIAQYEWFTGNIGTTINHEYLTPAVQPRPVSSAWLNTGERWTAQVVAGTAEATLISQRTDEQVWRITSTEGNATVTLPLMYWPGWTAIAKYPVTLTAARGSGLATMTPPAGVSEVTLRLRRTPTQWAAELLSVLAVLEIVGVSLRWWWRQPKRDLYAYISPFALDFLIISLLGLVALGWWDGRPTTLPSGNLSQDFGEMGYLHPAPTRILFSNGALLQDHQYLTDTPIMAGETLEMNLVWGSLPRQGNLPITVALTTPATYFYNDVAPLAQATAEFGYPITTLSIPIPADAPSGLYSPQILWENGTTRPLTPAGRPRAPLSLAPIRVVAAPSAAELPPTTPLEVRPVQASQRTPTVLDITVAWFTARPLGESYKASWRLTSETGIPFHEAQFDIQPGYGYLPTVGWPAGEWVQDRVALALPPPEERPFPPPYVQTVTLYDHTSQEVVLTRRLGVWVEGADGALRFAAHQPNFDLPSEMIELRRDLMTADQEAVIALRGFTQSPTANGVTITLYWEALQGDMADYHHFVHLLDPSTNQPLAQHDSMPRHNTYPTSQWVAGEIVADELFLSLADVPAGQFDLVAGLYQVTAEGFPRLIPVNPSGIVAQPDGLIFLQAIVIE